VDRCGIDGVVHYLAGFDSHPVMVTNRGSIPHYALSQTGLASGPLRPLDSTANCGAHTELGDYLLIGVGKIPLGHSVKPMAAFAMVG